MLSAEPTLETMLPEAVSTVPVRASYSASSTVALMLEACWDAAFWPLMRIMSSSTRHRYLKSAKYASIVLL